MSSPATGASPTTTGTPRRRIGRYTLLARLASGGMAEIYLARQQGAKGFEKLVVVKRILDSFAEDPDFVTMFLDEGRLAGQLSHPNIVQTFDLGEDQGTYFIAMEYVAGESIAKLARAVQTSGRLVDDRIAVRLIAQAAEALDYAHHKKDMHGKALHIVHRDVSPQNLVVTYDGQLKVLDFGIAKAANRHAHTESGKVKGKFSYMAPEQMHGQAIDGRADVFALGIVCFELVTGHRLVPGGDSAQAMLMISGADPLPRSRERRPSIDATLDQVIARAMERELARRYPTAGDFARALNAWLATRAAIGSTEVGALMHDLFKQEIGLRQQLIDKAMAGSDQIVEVDETQQRTPSMPSGLELPTVTAKAPRKRWLWPMLGGVVLAAAGAAGLWIARPRPPAPATLPTTDATPPKPPTIEPAVPSPPTVPPPENPGIADTATPKPPLPSPPASAIPPAKLSPATTEPPPKPRVSFGKLSIDTVPWTEVFWKGRNLGQTPLIGASLPVGSQQLTLRNPDQHLEQTVEVEIRKGETTAKHLRLQ